LVDVGHDVQAISFNYGQRHARELDAAKLLAGVLNINHEIIELPRVFSGSLVGDGDIPHGQYTDDSMRATVVPNRNMLMLSVAVSVAITRRAKYVAYAAHADDAGVYPDCRKVFVKAMRDCISLCDWWHVGLLTPFIEWTKKDIYRRAIKLDVPVGETWSCYEGGRIPCGQCGACDARKRAIRGES